MSNIHEGVSCDMCMKSNFSGKRYKCLLCYDFDLCSLCYEQSKLGLLSSTSQLINKPLNQINHNHINTHPMQCILTKADFDLFYGQSSSLNDYGEQLSFTCPYCGKIGFSESALCDHLSTQHLNSTNLQENLPQEVVCPICAALPSGSGGGDPNHLTEDLLNHIHLEHLNNRGIFDAADNLAGNSSSSAASVAAAAALRFSRRLNYAQNTTSNNRTTTASGLTNRNNTFRFTFGNSSSGNTLSSFMRNINSTSAIDSFGSIGSTGSDPIVELLSQLTGVRRAASNAHTANLTLAQLTRERETLQQQSASVARHHHLFSTGTGLSTSNTSNSNKLGLSSKTNVNVNNNTASNNNNLNNNNSNNASHNSSISQLNNQFINQILDLSNNLFLQQLPANTRDSRYLLAKYDFSNMDQNAQSNNNNGNNINNNKNLLNQSLFFNDILLLLFQNQLFNVNTSLSSSNENNENLIDDLLNEQQEQTQQQQQQQQTQPKQQVQI